MVASGSTFSTLSCVEDPIHQVKFAKVFLAKVLQLPMLGPMPSLLNTMAA